MTSAAPLRTSGAADDPALTWSGRTWTYREFHRLVAAAPTGFPVDVSAMTTPAALAAVFRAAHAGSAVLVSDAAQRADRIPRLPAGTWLVATTSGTTSRPRAIARTAASWAASVVPLAELARIDRRDSVLLTGPLHSTMHLHAAVHTLCLGAHLTDDGAKATVAHCVPTVLERIVAHRADYPRLRTVIVAGAAAPATLADGARDAGLEVTEYYGAAELSFVAARRWPDPLLRPFPGVEVRIDPAGVLWARSAYLARGYLDLAGGSSAEPVGGPSPLRPLTEDAEGFATVGDLAHAPEGSPEPGFTLRGRGDDAVTTGGHTVLTADVEAAIRSIPGVRDVAAFGVDHRRLGQIIAVAVEMDSGPPDPPGAGRPADDRRRGELRAATRTLLPERARPRAYVILEALPRTAAGKVDRAALREAYGAARAPVAGRSPGHAPAGSDVPGR